MSKLIVEVCKIEEVQKHPNADKLDVVRIKGWWSIVSRNQYNVGNYVVFLPPDAIVPDNLIEKYKLDYLKKNGRLKTIKLRGFISQGLCLPCDCLPNSNKYLEGENVAEILGIKKYEAPEANYQQKPKETIYNIFIKYKNGDITFKRFIKKSIALIKDIFKPKKKINPLFDKYTDIENIKNFHTIFKTDDNIIITEKVHGTNFRVGNLKRPTHYFWQRWIIKLLGEYEFVYGSHNVQLTNSNERFSFYGDNVYGQIAKRYKLAEIIPEDYILYGEIYGKKIQELQYGLSEIDVVFFDIKYKDKYLDYDEFTKFCSERNLPVVPLLFRGKFDNDMLVYCTNGQSILAKRNNKDQIREGCVVKPEKEENHNRVGRKILKSISEEYLLTKNRTEHH